MSIYIENRIWGARPIDQSTQSAPSDRLSDSRSVPSLRRPGLGAYEVDSLVDGHDWLADLRHRGWPDLSVLRLIRCYPIEVDSVRAKWPFLVPAPLRRCSVSRHCKALPFRSCPTPLRLGIGPQKHGRRTGRPKRSTAGPKRCVGTPSDSGTYSTTGSGHCCDLTRAIDAL